MLNKALDILNKYYGYSSFRNGQEKIISEILKGNDTVAIMPTGGGKSVCYQVPALLLEGVTVVISPLISLMKDQVDSIKEIGVEAAYINSSLSNLEIANIIEKIRFGDVKILYVAPERLESSQFIALMSSVNISQVAVDEAHCVSQWGHDFRTSYRKIKVFINSLNKRPIVTAFTATATVEVREDIVGLLALEEPKVFIYGFDRENLKINILKGVDKRQYLMEYIKENSSLSGIIYTATRNETDKIYDLLNSRGYSVGRYHAGLSDSERTENQEAFVYDKTSIMVATNAFGMGIDKPNIRYVIHYNMPKNVESYYQEIGRAGRDGDESECILLFSPSDVHTQKYIIDIGTDNPQRKSNEYKKLKQMMDLVHCNSCIRGYILNYFGEEAKENCNNCSSCNLEGELVDKTIDAQKVLSCVYRMNRPYGVNMIIDVLRGSENKKLKDLRLNELSTYGIMKDYTKDNLKNFINTLMAHGYMDSSEGEYPVVKLNQRSVSILKSEEKVVFKEATKVDKIFVSNSLFETLKILRKSISEEEGVPPYMIFGDSTLKEMSTRYPQALEQFLDINGVGEVKAQKYGKLFIDEVVKYVNKNNITIDWVNKKIESSSEKSIVKSNKAKSFEVTIEMIKSNMNLLKVCKERELTLTTVFSHILDFKKEGNKIDFPIDFTNIINEKVEAEVLKAINGVGYERLKPIKDVVSTDITYDQIRAVILKNYQ